MTQSFFEKRIKPILLYVGAIGAVAMSIGYIILMFVLVLGFNEQANMTQAIVFAVVNAVVGFLIMQFLKIQGIDFAKQLPNNIKVLNDYNHKKPKKKTTHSLKFFWIKTISTDILIKASMLCITTAGIIYIVVEGSNDYNMLLLSIVNLIMFACFGLLSLVKAYDFFNESYIPYLEEKIDEEEKEIARKAEEKLAMAKKECVQQRNVPISVDSRTNILESSNCNSNNGTVQPMVLDGGNSDNTVLVRSVHTGDGTSDCTCNRTEETIQENKNQKGE